MTRKPDKSRTARGRGLGTLPLRCASRRISPQFRLPSRAYYLPAPLADLLLEGMLGRLVLKVNPTFSAKKGLLQLRVLRLGVLQDGDVEVGVLSSGERFRAVCESQR